jgi:hypothetical protein
MKRAHVNVALSCEATPTLCRQLCRTRLTCAPQAARARREGWLLLPRARLVPRSRFLRTPRPAPPLLRTLTHHHAALARAWVRGGAAMRGALTLCVLACVSTRAAAFEVDGFDAEVAALFGDAHPPPPPPPPPPLGDAAARPRPRIHVYDLPDALTQPCWWWGCGKLTQTVRESKVCRRCAACAPPPPIAAGALSRAPVWRSRGAAVLHTRAGGGGLLVDPAPGAAACAPARTHARLPLSQPRVLLRGHPLLPPPQQPFLGQNVTEALYSYIATHWPFWNDSVRANVLTLPPRGTRAHPACACARVPVCPRLARSWRRGTRGTSYRSRATTAPATAPTPSTSPSTSARCRRRGTR